MKILFCGDVCCRDFQNRNNLCDEELRKLIHAHDYSFCNLEGPIYQGETKARKAGPYKNNSYSIKTVLMHDGFNAVTLANNHIMDYGIEGLKSTLAILDESFIHVGAGCDVKSVYKPQVLHSDTETVAVFSVCEKQFGACAATNHDGFAWMFSPVFFRNLRNAIKECDFTIVVCHCGLEELDVPLPEVRNLYKEFVEIGVDLVIGHHPHVIQGNEEYKGKNIFYSLGNFAFDNEDGSAYNPDGAVLSVNINGGKIDCRWIETFYDNGVIHIKNDCLKIVSANNRLYFEGYDDIVNVFCKQLFEEHFVNYIANSIGLDLRSKDNMIKFLKHRFNDEPIKLNDLLMYHNISVETNRWTIEHAIGDIR